MLVVLLEVQSPVSAEETGCEFVQWGFAYTRFTEGNSDWSYVVTLAGLNWKQSPYGWHAPGLLECRFCEAFGLYVFGVGSDRNRRRPPTAATRVERSSEVFGYPHSLFSKDQLEFLWSREPISIGPLTGYAVQYKGFLVISVTDNCVTFETTLKTQRTDDWDLIGSLLKEISIEKRPGTETPAAPPGSVTVRPRRPDEEPVWLHKTKPTREE
jgi:hypothetical protein